MKTEGGLVDALAVGASRSRGPDGDRTRCPVDRSSLREAPDLPLDDGRTTEARRRQRFLRSQQRPVGVVNIDLLCVLHAFCLLVCLPPCLRGFRLVGGHLL